MSRHCWEPNQYHDCDLIKRNSTNDCGLSSCSFSVCQAQKNSCLALPLKMSEKCCLHHPCACLRLATPQRGLPGQHPTELQPQSYVKSECVTKSTKSVVTNATDQPHNADAHNNMACICLHGFSMVSLNQLKAFLEIEARLDILHGRLEQ